MSVLIISFKYNKNFFVRTINFRKPCPRKINKFAMLILWVRDMCNAWINELGDYSTDYRVSMMPKSKKRWNASIDKRCYKKSMRSCKLRETCIF